MKGTTDTSWKILMIDDDEDDFFIAREMLKSAKGQKHNVEWVSTYEAGRQALYRDHYNAVLVDYDLGAHSGIELIREANEREYPAPLILFTGRGNYEVDVEAMQAGATLYLTKSEANPLLLERAIRYAIEMKQKELTLRASEGQLREREAKLLESQAQLRLSEERFNKAFNANPNAMLISQIEDGQIEAINDSFERLLGYSQDELIGKTTQGLNLYARPGDRAAVIREIKEFGFIRDFELDLYTKSRDVRNALMSVEMLNIGGQPLILSVFQDITEQKRLTEQNREQRDLLERLVQSAQVGIAFLKGPQHVYTLVNQEYLRYAQGKGELIGHPVAEIWPEIAPIVIPQMNRVYQTGEPFSIKDAPLPIVRDGIPQDEYFSYTFTPIYDADGNIEGEMILAIDTTQAVLNQQAVEAQSARLKTVLNALPVGVWITDANGRVVEKNEQADRIWAGDAPLVKGVDQYQEYQSWDVQTGKKLETEDFALTRVLRTGQPMEPVEQRILRFDGSEGFVLVSAIPIKDREGRLVGTVAINLDITERKQAEQALKEGQARQIEFVESTSNNYIALDREWRFTYANRHYGQVVGIDPHELIGKNYWETFPQYLGTELEQNYRKVMTEKVPLHYHQKGIYTNGLYEVSLFPTQEGMAVFSIDRTEELRHQQQLENERARMEAVLQALPVAVWIADENGQLLFKNEQTNHIWGGDAPLSENIAGYEDYVAWFMDSGKRVAPDDFPVAQVLITGERSQPAELHIRRFDGTEGAVLALGSPIRDHEGRLTGAVAINVDITERKQAEDTLRKTADALRESESKYLAMFQSAPFSIVLARLADGVIVDVNPAWQDLFEVDKEEAVGRSALELSTIPDPETRARGYEEMRTTGRLHNFEMKFRTKTGKEFISSNNAEVIDFNGTKYLLSTTEDITERKQAEEALRESRSRLERAQQIAHLGSWELELSNNRLTWSDEVYRIFGLEPQEFAATYEAFLERVHPEDRAAVDEAYSGSLRDHLDSYEIEHRVVRAHTGEMRFVHEKCEHIRDAVGQIVRSVGMVHDITERKQAEEAMRTSEAHFRYLADAMPQLVWTAKPDGTVDYYNKRVLEYDGFALPQDNQWDGSPVLHPDDVEPTTQAWAQAVQSGEMYQIEHRVRMRDGTYRWHLSRGVPVKDHSGRITRWYGTATDIEDQKQTEDKLRHSNQELEQFAFVASHDLKEPLRKIILFGQSLRRHLSDTENETAADYLNRMQNAAERMQMMINGLLELSRVSTRAAEFAPVNLNQVAEEAVGDLESRIQAVQGQVMVDSLPTVQGDALQLRQLFQNLIGNALKFHKTDEPPVVHVSGAVVPQQKGPMIEIQVADNGIGFEQQYADRIFQPFQRLHSRAEYEGTGLGLAICQKIVERHQGTIEVRSAPGDGSVFTIRLPRKKAG